LPTKRRKLPPQRINLPTPEWVRRLLADGQPPRTGDDGYDQYFGWLFCSEAVPGLPDPMSTEGYQLWRRSPAKGIRAAPRWRRNFRPAAACLWALPAMPRPAAP
jgi:hypothetical protein